ncbi:MAG: beta-ketoacyl synthase N-terminal-like domain-containing protein [Elusimicrobiota bacterium]
MNILGIGTIFNRGRGVSSFAEALQEGWVSPSISTDPFSPVYRVDPELLNDQEIARKIRRADKFATMAVIAASDAVKDSGIPADQVCSSLGIIVSTGFGPHATTFHFLDDILTYGDAGVSPTSFSHSVHNAAASYIASLLKSRGPAITLTQFAFPFHQALIIAQAWIKEGRCKNVLVGGVDECGTVMEYVCRKKLSLDAQGKIRPFQFSDKPVTVPGEGSVFFLLGEDNDQPSYCKIEDVYFDPDRLGGDKPDLYLLDADGMTGDESVYRKSIAGNIPAASYTPLFGAMMMGSAFHCLAGALSIKNNLLYACPVPENPFNISICKLTTQAKISSIHCIKFNCSSRPAVIRLTT